VPGIVGLAKALEISQDGIEERARTITELRDYFIRRLMESIPGVRLNGHPIRRLPNNANILIENAEGESVLLMLDMKGIAASSGSACTAGAVEPSHVLRAIGLPLHAARTTLRFSLGRSTTKENLDFAVDSLVEITERLRTVSAR
jgi:cysteine desulfurase